MPGLYEHDREHGHPDAGAKPNGTADARGGGHTRRRAAAGASVTTADLLSFPLTDSGNAERLIAAHGDGLRYVPPWDKWLAWNGARWVLEPRAGAVYRAAKKMVRSFQKRAIGDPEALMFAARQESKKSLDAMVALARHERGVLAQHEDFDRNPMLLNVKNGTINLETGELGHHRREDLITKLAPVTYDPTAECPRFDRFLSEIMAGDEELVAFLVVFLGYCLTGQTREHVLAFWHGPGGNGKGKLGAVMLHLMGDYAGKAAPDLLFRGERTDRHPT
ncbi:MAG: DNA primase family protein, partial [Polyangiaceae bacterium]